MAVVGTIRKLWPVENWWTRLGMVVYWLACVGAAVFMATAIIAGFATGR
ncbi:hypothetical protein [Nocardia abscessus]|nr:hypothetical protein [Nocardia abscessus]